jgi:hypothetical protein
MTDPLAITEPPLITPHQKEGNMDMEIAGPDGGESAAPEMPETQTGMVLKHDTQSAPLFDSARGDSPPDEMNTPTAASRYEDTDSGTRHTALPDERIEKRDKDTAWTDDTSTNESPPSNLKKTKKFKTEDIPKPRERTRSKTRHIDAP